MNDIASQQLNVAKNYFDFQGLNQLKNEVGKETTDQDLKAVAQQFEGMFIQMMLKSMREANQVFAEGNMFDSHSTQFYQGMYDQQMSMDMAGNGGLGLTDLLVQQLKGMR